MDTRDVLKAYQSGKVEREEMGMFAGKLQQAMIEDEILPQYWEIV